MFLPCKTRMPWYQIPTNSASMPFKTEGGGHRNQFGRFSVEDMPMQFRSHFYTLKLRAKDMTQ